MKKLAKQALSFLLAAVLLFGIAECAVPAIAEAPILEGSLYLTVSSITFSVLGEKEDIYLGVIPRELVTWESENPSIISVKDGVLQAVGVGTTTIHATYYDREASCTATCLARTKQELSEMDINVLHSPKRVAPKVDMSEPCTYFDNAAIVGDSISYVMMQYESKGNYLGSMLFLARGGVSMMGFVLGSKKIYYQGQETPLEYAVAQSNVERVYFLMGSNDVGANYDWNTVFNNWDTVLGRIFEKSPNVEIVIISSIPQYDYNYGHTLCDTYNERTVEYNTMLRQYAKDNGYMFLNLHQYIEDHTGRMPAMFHQDNYHLNEDGCMKWMEIMRYYAQYESEGGILE